MYTLLTYPFLLVFLHVLVSIDLQFTYPPTYPDIAPDISVIANSGLSDEHLSQIEAHLPTVVSVLCSL